MAKLGIKVANEKISDMGPIHNNLDTHDEVIDINKDFTYNHTTCVTPVGAAR